MSAGTPILLERDNVNDEMVILSRWLVQDGERVEEGMLIAEVETSKANVDVTAPNAGYLRWNCSEKADIAYTEPIGYIFGEPRTACTSEPAQNAKVEAPSSQLVATVMEHPLPGISTDQAERTSVINLPVFSSSTDHPLRFSRRAMELLIEHQIPEDRFSGKTLVRADDVLAHIEGQLNQAAIASGTKESTSKKLQQGPSTVMPKLAVTELPLSRMKRSEVQALSAGASNTLPSSVSVTCLTTGLRRALEANPIVAGNAGAVVVYEAARLLRKYPVFNATYRPGMTLAYEQVNIGYAMDDGRGLKVAILRDCDHKSLSEITSELRELTLAYLDDKLTPTQVTGGTFTVSDLSGFGVANFVPLISEDQGAILGLGSEQYLPGSRDGLYTLTLGFDHQLSEGRTAALFLNDLKDRLLHYEKAMGDRTPESVPTCARCGRGTSDLPDSKSYLVQSVVPPGYLCNLCIAGF